MIPFYHNYFIKPKMSCFQKRLSTFKDRLEGIFLELFCPYMDSMISLTIIHYVQKIEKKS